MSPAVQGGETASCSGRRCISASAPARSPPASSVCPPGPQTAAVYTYTQRERGDRGGDKNILHPRWKPFALGFKALEKTRNLVFIHFAAKPGLLVMYF